MALAVTVPFNLQTSEFLVWVFGDVKYYEYQTSIRHEGGSRGASIRVARGVYYRVDAFHGHPIREQHLVVAESGILGLTDKHLFTSRGPVRASHACSGAG